MGMLLRRHHESKEADRSADLPLMTEENEEMTKNPAEDVIEEISEQPEEEISAEVGDPAEVSGESNSDKKTGKKTAARKSGKKTAAKE